MRTYANTNSSTKRSHSFLSLRYGNVIFYSRFRKRLGIATLRRAQEQRANKYSKARFMPRNTTARRSCIAVCETSPLHARIRPDKASFLENLLSNCLPQNRKELQPRKLSGLDSTRRRELRFPLSVAALERR